MKIKFAILVVLCGFALISCSTIESKKYFDRSEENYKLGKFSEAMIDLDSGLAISPNYKTRNFDKGKIFYSLKKYDSAFIYLTDYIDKNPKNASAYYFRSLSRHEQSEYNDIDFSDIHKAMNLEPNNGDYYNYRAELKKVIGQYESALKDLNWAIKLNDLDYRNYHSRALLKFHFLKDTIGGMQDIYKSMEIFPKNPYLISVAGYLYFEQKKYNEAEKCFIEAINIDTTFAHTYYKLGLTRKYFKDFEKSFYYIDKAIKIDYSNDYFYIGRANVNFELGKFKESIVDYDRILEINPFLGDAFYGKGKSLYKLGNYNEAIECLNKSFSLMTSQEDISIAYYYSGLSKMEMKDEIGACQDFTKAKEKGYLEANEKISQYCNKK